MPQAEARALVLNAWYDAGLGWPIYDSGAYRGLMASGELDATFAKNDLQRRLNDCQLIIGMEAEGSLAGALGQPGVQGLGFYGALGEPLSGTTIAIIVGVVAIVCFCAYVMVQQFSNYMENRARDAKMTSLCGSAQLSAEDKKRCAEWKDQKPAPPTDPVELVIYAATALAAFYLLTQFVIPNWVASASDAYDRRKRA